MGKVDTNLCYNIIHLTFYYTIDQFYLELEWINLSPLINQRFYCLKDTEQLDSRGGHKQENVSSQAKEEVEDFARQIGNQPKQAFQSSSGKEKSQREEEEQRSHGLVNRQGEEQRSHGHVNRRREEQRSHGHGGTWKDRQDERREGEDQWSHGGTWKNRQGEEQRSHGHVNRQAEEQRSHGHGGTWNDRQDERRVGEDQWSHGGTWKNRQGEEQRSHGHGETWKDHQDERREGEDQWNRGGTCKNRQDIESKEKPQYGAEGETYFYERSPEELEGNKSGVLGAIGETIAEIAQTTKELVIGPQGEMDQNLQQQAVETDKRK